MVDQAVLYHCPFHLASDVGVVVGISKWSTDGASQL